MNTDTNGNINLNTNGSGLTLNSSQHFINYSTTVGALSSITCRNDDSTNTLSDAALLVYSTGTGGGDAYIQMQVNGITAYAWGIDNSDSDILKLTSGSPSSGTNYWNMTKTGERTMPLQPAFNAYVTGQINNVTGDGTAYSVIFNSELFDQNADFDTSTGVFTAPIAGKYYFNTNISLTGLLSGHTSGRVNIVTTGQTCTIWDGNPYAISDASGEIAISGGIFIDMTASGTAYVTVTVSGSTKVVDVRELFTMGSNFQGWLVC